MTREERLGPIDLMMLGRVDEAAELYLDLYPEVAGDMFIAPLTMSQLIRIVAHKEKVRANEDVLPKVEDTVLRAMEKRGVEIDESLVKYDVGLGMKSLEEDRKHADRMARRWV